MNYFEVTYVQYPRDLKVAVEDGSILRARNSQTLARRLLGAAALTRPDSGTDGVWLCATSGHGACPVVRVVPLTEDSVDA